MCRLTNCLNGLSKGFANHEANGQCDSRSRLHDKAHRQLRAGLARFLVPSTFLDCRLQPGGSFGGLFGDRLKTCAGPARRQRLGVISCLPSIVIMLFKEFGLFCKSRLHVFERLAIFINLLIVPPASRISLFNLSMVSSSPQSLGNALSSSS